MGRTIAGQNGWLSAGPLLLNFHQYGLGETEAGIPQPSDDLVEFDQASLIGIVKDREGTSYFEASAGGFPSTREIVDQHYARCQFAGKRDRLALSEVMLQPGAPF